MANELDSIMAALGGGGGFFDSPQTTFEQSQIVNLARQRQQQYEQAAFLAKILEAQSTQKIREKQETDPEARIVQLLKERQIAPTTGTAQGKPMTLQPSGDVIGQLTALMSMQQAKHKTTAPPDRLGAILTEMSNREKVIRELNTRFQASGKDKGSQSEIKKLAIAERGALLRDMETMQGLGPEWGAIAQGFGSRMETAFHEMGVPFTIRPESGGQAPATGQQPPATKTPEKPPRKQLTPEEQQAALDVEPDPMAALQFLMQLFEGISKMPVGRPVGP